MQLLFIVAGHVDHGGEEVVQVEAIALGVGHHILDDAVVHHDGKAGVAQHRHNGLIAGLGGQLHLGHDFGIAANESAFYLDALFLADGGVELGNLIINSFLLSARAAGVPEQDLDGRFGAVSQRSTGQRQHHDQGQRKGYEFLHAIFLLIVVYLDFPLAGKIKNTGTRAGMIILHLKRCKCWNRWSVIDRIKQIIPNKNGLVKRKFASFVRNGCHIAQKCRGKHAFPRILIDCV